MTTLKDPMWWPARSFTKEEVAAMESLHRGMRELARTRLAEVVVVSAKEPVDVVAVPDEGGDL